VRMVRGLGKELQPGAQFDRRIPIPVASGAKPVGLWLGLRYLQQPTKRAAAAAGFGRWRANPGPVGSVVWNRLLPHARIKPLKRAQPPEGGGLFVLSA
jgi:hypothetical protein